MVKKSSSLRPADVKERAKDPGQHRRRLKEDEDKDIRVEAIRTMSLDPKLRDVPRTGNFRPRAPRTSCVTWKKKRGWIPPLDRGGLRPIPSDLSNIPMKSGRKPPDRHRARPHEVSARRASPFPSRFGVETSTPTVRATRPQAIAAGHGARPIAVRLPVSCPSQRPLTKGIYQLTYYQ